MSYRTIAVHVNGSRHMPARTTLAAGLATRFNAHLIGMAATGGAGPYYSSGMTGEGAAALSLILEYMKGQATASLSRFAEAVEREQWRAAELRVIEEEASEALTLQARYSDLLVIGQPDPDEKLPGEDEGVAERAVMRSGKPVLVIPYAGRFENGLRRVVVAWNGGLDAARAISGALPILQQADIVQLVVFNPARQRFRHGEVPGSDIALYLARHDVKVEVTQRETDASIDVGNALLSHAADFNADLIVMGCYGHSKLRETLLGGVTKTVMQSMTVPVLMAH